MNLIIGQRISTRGEDFIITRSDEILDGSWRLKDEGMSKQVKGICFTFDFNLESDVKPIDSNNKKIIADNDSCYRKANLL
jgi:hypothetical protein